ncbi:MAG TPA: ATP-binding cassette domain-containing protein, partial [Candidatus Cloacimonadota bacterium]|nr:ATP-binding cassette domain-containing protein [Candidatus Cloacimonadota bacterium]
IGVDNIKPKELYITKVKDYWHITRTPSSQDIIQIVLKDNGYYLIPPKKQSSIYVNRQPVNEPVLLNLNSDIISIGKRNFRINSFYDLIETPLEIQKLNVIDVKHYYQDGQIALDSVSFEAEKGQLIGIMGQSGCGKSTLTKVLSTEIIPTWGQVLIDGQDLASNAPYFMEYMGYVPQDDLLYPNLTVFENLWYRLRLRMPQLSTINLDQKVDNILNQVNLNHHRSTRVGDLFKKNLSGGERKRLNLALELLFEPTIIICDEPTSGLSFNEAEQIIDILKSLCAQGKIVIITIHQPNSSLFRKFDRILMMDMGGRIAYYGDPQNSFDYFDEELGELTVKKAEIEKKRHLLTSDYFYDVISYPEYNEQDEPVFEQVNRQIRPKRKFSPEYWRDKHKRKMLFDMIQSDVPSPEPTVLNLKKPKRRGDLKSYYNSFKAYVSRSFKMKLRNRTNNIITFIEAPLLALVISFILRHTTSGSYAYADNNNIFIYIFVAVITFIFLGMSNSIEEILAERKIILRERLMNLKMSYYLISKLTTLGIFSFIQALLFHQIAAMVLGIRGLFWINIAYLFLASLTGFSLGMLCSAFIREGRTVINILPLILIPQIIFGGAVIEFERMNRSLTIFERHPIPEIVQIIPSRWLFEGLATSYAKNTVFHRALAKVEKNELTYIRNYRNAVISRDEFDALRFNTYAVKNEIARKWNPDKILNTNLNAAVSVMDGKALNTNRSEFMSSYKFWGKTRMRTWNFNSIIILLIVMGLNLITWIKLKYFFKD